MKRSKKLVWNVYNQESHGSNEIQLKNILEYSFIKNDLLALEKEYKKARKQFILKNQYTYKDYDKDVVFIRNEKFDIEEFDNKFKNEVFALILKRSLMHIFWSRCEYEILLTNLMPSISPAELERINNEKNKYRNSVNLETELKIDVWDQIHNNWEPFIDYLWKYYQEADLT